MYLKQLDILGFKSFADKTRLTFEPGMIAIVGPNGCGKSNVSDAIRWVLGEQRPTALRCSKLVDVVFNGTDTRKPLGLCEVSITFADCEKELGTEYHEVTVTRRVYRDGAGEYFINKTRSGLKDIKRLFMGTGIGTTSYSVMAQGQIDQILSSKPEDRRAVFEEAAGITKFKADRKEAIRKIEQTEQNLLREADVLREMKRQIGSLQRQVGKAEKYKELRDELRGLDIYVSKGKIQAFNLALEMNVVKQRETEQTIQDATIAVNAAESESQQLHADIHAIEERLATLASEAASAESQLARAREVITVNEQRITEYRMFSDRDGREIAETRQTLEELGMQVESLEQKRALLEEGLETAQAELDEAEARFKASTAQIDELRQQLQESRTGSALCDRHAAEVRDEIARLEGQAREAILARERLNSELAQLQESTARADATLAEVKARLDAAQAQEESASVRAQTSSEALETLRREIAEARENLGEMQTAAATKEAQLEMLKDESAAKTVLENVLQDQTGDVKIAALETGREGATIAEGDRLVEHLTLTEEDREAADRLLGDVVLVGGKDGVWMPSTSMAPSSGHLSPITQAEHDLAELREKIERARETLATGAERTQVLQEETRAAEAALAEARRAAAQAEGEYTSVARDADAVRARLTAVEGELNRVKEANAGEETRRSELTQDLEDTIAKRDALMDRTTELQDRQIELEAANAEESRHLTEKRIAAAHMESELDLTARQSEDAAKRRAELQKTIEGRENGIRGYEESIQRLQEETAELMASIDPLREKALMVRSQVEEEKINRTSLQNQLAQADAAVGGKRQALDEARAFKGKLEVAATEATMRRQNVYDHLSQEYGLDPQAVLREPDPDWGKRKEPPPNDELEARVNSLNAQIAALGPVNMVAIDEFRELEERYTREKAQEADLLAAKEQIMALITNLNGKSGELFRATFEQANANFQKMFTKLFNGGEAKLVLLENQEDPLECGIDIIARPPGKRPQSVTLLSGGERTMTAVALLFAIFRIKPAPFTMLDELDAALDDANIGRFVDALKEFLDRSQFLIITHNQHTIAGSDLVYGVSQQEKGVSRIISMRLSDLGVKAKK
ncbi:MAG: AAA family ATPase [Kiritimatiellae bacterium]|nr:AAA family ATPase [Kiritimatiellia bacterium]